ncbi:MAG: hypothetical protein WCE69_15440 [Aestuariivirga sp.]
MSYREALSQRMVAISISESPDMPVLGLSQRHLLDAMAEIARHLLALGARLVYGGDLRTLGFTELLFELVERHRRDADEGDMRASVLNYLAWPVHIGKSATELEEYMADLSGSAALVLLALDGRKLMQSERATLEQARPSDSEWEQGLTAMREVMLAQTHARIVLGGRTEEYKGIMPGIAEETLLSLRAKQPLFLMGGFGGCARDVAETLGLNPAWKTSSRLWSGRKSFEAFGSRDLNNGLTAEENVILAQTIHIDQAVTLILRGLLRTEQLKSQQNI